MQKINVCFLDCRVCGLLYCSKCVQHKMTLPPTFGHGTKPQSCCGACVHLVRNRAVKSPQDIFAMRRKLATPKSSLSKSAQPSQRSQKPKAQAVSFPPKKRMPSPSDPPAAVVERDSNSQRNLNGSGVDCSICSRSFNKLGRRIHHCKRCSNGVCGSCSEGAKPIKEMGYNQPVRHCKRCMEQPLQYNTLLIKAAIRCPEGKESLASVYLKSTVELQKIAPETEKRTKEAYQLRIVPVPAENPQASIARKDLDSFSMTCTRNYTDFEWLYEQLSALTSSKALPNFAARDQKNDPELRRKLLDSFIASLLMHPILRDLPPTKAFCGLSNNDFNKFIRGEYSPSGAFMTGDITVWFRFRIQEFQLQKNVSVAVARKTSHEDRLANQAARHSLELKRTSTQNDCLGKNGFRINSLRERMQNQKARIVREKERLELQQNARHILFHDTASDKEERRAAIAERTEQYAQFSLAQEAFFEDMKTWNENLMAWCQHHAKWGSSRGTAKRNLTEEFLWKAYGIQDLSISDRLTMLSKNLEAATADEPAYMQSESVAIETEWNELSTERDVWSSYKELLDKEEKAWLEEDAAYDDETNIVEQENDCRQAKVEKIEEDLKSVEEQVKSREDSIEERKAFHSELQEDYDAWKSMQTSRFDASKLRCQNHELRLTDSSTRIETMKQQCEMQSDAKRVLSFDRTNFKASYEKDQELVVKDTAVCHRVMKEAAAEEKMIPDILSRLKTNMQVRNKQLQNLSMANKSTCFESPDGKLDERDAYMVEVNARRQRMQKVVDLQKSQLMDEASLVDSLQKQLHDHIDRLQAEQQEAKRETQLIDRFQKNVSVEKDLYKQASSQQDQKKKEVQDCVAASKNWIQVAMTEHSKRKQDEASRMLEQATQAAEVQRLIQRYTNRIITRESRMIQQKYRVLGCKNRLESLKSSKQWYESITSESCMLKAHKLDSKADGAALKEQQEDESIAKRLHAHDTTKHKTILTLSKNAKDIQNSIEANMKQWAHLQSTYMSSQRDEDEDMSFSNEIQAELSNLESSFGIMTSRVQEEMKCLENDAKHSDQEMQSIDSFKKRMDTEEKHLVEAERDLLTQELNLINSEKKLIETKSSELMHHYKELQDDHSLLFDRINTIKKNRYHRQKQVSLPVDRIKEIQYLEKAMQNSSSSLSLGKRNSFTKKFKVSSARELSSVQDIVEYLEDSLQENMDTVSTWKQDNINDRKQLEEIQSTFQKTDWNHDEVSRIPAAREIIDQLPQDNSGGKSSSKIAPELQWLVEIILFKRLLVSKDNECKTQIHEMLTTFEKELQKVLVLEKQIEKYQNHVSSTKDKLGITQISQTTEESPQPAPKSIVSATFISKYANPDLNDSEKNATKIDLPSTVPNTKHGDDLLQVDRVSTLSVEM